MVDSFLGEVALKHPNSLTRLNELFQVWLSECYQNKPHSALGEHITPEMAFRSDKKSLHFLDPETIRQAFMHAVQRKVDKSGCVSFNSHLYEVGLSLVGRDVTVVYDPSDPTQIMIEKEGCEPWEAKPLEIGERVGKRPDVPKPAVSFSKVIEEGERFV